MATPQQTLDLIDQLTGLGMPPEAFAIILQGTGYTDIEKYKEYLRELIERETRI